MVEYGENEGRRAGEFARNAIGNLETRVDALENNPFAKGGTVFDKKIDKLEEALDEVDNASIKRSNESSAAVEEEIRNNNQRMEYLNRNFLVQEDNVNEQGLRILTLQTQVGSLRGELDAQGTRLVTVEGRVTTVEAQEAANRDRIDSHDGRIRRMKYGWIGAGMLALAAIGAGGYTVYSGYGKPKTGKEAPKPSEISYFPVNSFLEVLRVEKTQRPDGEIDELIVNYKLYQEPGVKGTASNEPERPETGQMRIYGFKDNVDARTIETYLNRDRIFNVSRNLMNAFYAAPKAEKLSSGEIVNYVPSKIIAIGPSGASDSRDRQ